MRKKFFYIGLFLLLCTSCISNKSNYIIGVSIDKSDEWHDKMCDEIVHEAVLFSDITLNVVNANDNKERQVIQIDSLLDQRVQALIICIENPIHIQKQLKRADAMGIPVILNAKNKDIPWYSAYVGMDNVMVGQIMAEYARDIATKDSFTSSHPLCAVELLGEVEAPAVSERYIGLHNSLNGMDNLSIVSVVNCYWSRIQARQVMDSLLRTLPQIDVVLAQNDMMALGAADAIAAYPNHKSIRILGVDAQSGKGRGVEAILEGTISASITNESRGDLLVKTAAQILYGEPYTKDSLLTPMLVDGSSKKLMRRLTQEMSDEDKVIQTLQLRVDRLWGHTRTLQTTSGLLGVLLGCILLIVVFVVWMTSYRRRTNKEQKRNAQLMQQQQLQLEEIRAELEKVKTTQPRDDEFIENFKQKIEQHIDDSDYSVENMCKDLGVSRAQLFRKVKAQTGVTPLEVIRQVRMRKARQLIQNTDLTIQQVGYSVGYSLPSYFSKTYKEYYGILPSEESRAQK